MGLRARGPETPKEVGEVVVEVVVGEEETPKEVVGEVVLVVVVCKALN